MHRNDGASPRRDGSKYRVERGVQSPTIHVDEDGRCTKVDSYFGARRKGPRWHDDLITAPDADSFKGKVKRRGRRVKGKGVASPDHGREGRLKCLDARACREPPRVEDFHDGPPFRVCN